MTSNVRNWALLARQQVDREWPSPSSSWASGDDHTWWPVRERPYLLWILDSGSTLLSILFTHIVGKCYDGKFSSSPVVLDFVSCIFWALPSYR
jgi:hypothetical protein